MLRNESEARKMLSSRKNSEDKAGFEAVAPEDWRRLYAAAGRNGELVKLDGVRNQE